MNFLVFLCAFAPLRHCVAFWNPKKGVGEFLSPTPFLFVFG